MLDLTPSLQYNVIAALSPRTAVRYGTINHNLYSNLNGFIRSYRILYIPSLPRRPGLAFAPLAGARRWVGGEGVAPRPSPGGVGGSRPRPPRQGGYCSDRRVRRA
eukprot:4319607-Prymnesium_polylepis.1